MAHARHRALHGAAGQTFDPGQTAALVFAAGGAAAGYRFVRSAT